MSALGFKPCFVTRAKPDRALIAAALYLSFAIYTAPASIGRFALTLQIIFVLWKIVF
jgi:hypothetical protein